MKKTIALLIALILMLFSVFSAYASVSDADKMLGDVNGDNSVAVLDATLTQRNVAKLESFSGVRGKHNKKGRENSRPLIISVRYFVGKTA